MISTALENAVKVRDEEILRLEKENTLLRAALANSKDPCIYCQLPADEMAKCRAGFPGCARMDDISGCPEFGSMMEAYQLREELERERSKFQQIKDQIRQWSEAFPETFDLFRPLERADYDFVKENRNGLIDRCSAAMGRYMAKRLLQFCETLEKDDGEEAQTTVERGNLHPEGDGDSDDLG